MISSKKINGDDIMSRQIDADEFIKHTQNLIDKAKKDNDRMMEAFFQVS